MPSIQQIITTSAPKAYDGFGRIIAETKPKIKGNQSWTPWTVQRPQYPTNSKLDRVG